MPLRYTGGGYQHHGYGHHANHDYGADHSLRSSKYSHDSRRRRKNTCCIFLLLLLGALLIAIGIGIMVYYLLRNDDPKTIKHTATEADGSLPLLNVNYTDSMAQNSSEAFLAVSNPLCKELDSYFRDSEHKYRYQGCTIEELRPDENTETCECAGIINKARTTRAYFRLLFLGDISDIREEVRRVIQEKATRVAGSDYKALLVDKFIVDISSVFPEGFSTPQPPPAVGVLANLTIWVYNLTYSDDLLQPTSTVFQDIAQPFCADLARLFRNSSLSGRYHSCEVKGFSSTPDVVIVHVWLTDDDVTGVERDLRTIIVDKARVIIIDGESRKIIGPLLITPSGGDGNVVIIPIPVNPLSTIKPTPTSTVGPGYQRYIDMQLFLYGFTYNDSFANPSDPVFQVYAHNYCKDLERILLHSSWMGHFFGCRLYGFYPRQTPEEFPYFGTHLGIDDVITEQRSREIIDIIRNNATLVTVENENLAVYQIGDLLVILGERIKINVTYLPSMMTSTMTSTPSLTPSIMPTVFTTSYHVTPTPTPGQTVSASVSTIVIVYDSTTAFVDSELYDFTYNTVLTDTTSTLFLSIQNKFCDDIDDFFGVSELSNQFLECRILQFMPGDNTHFKFRLTFQHALNSMLRDAVRRIILTSAPASQKGGYEVISVGDLDLIVDLIGYTASLTNYTEVTETTFQPSPTMTMSMTSTPYVTYSATLAEITCEVVSNIPPVLEITSSSAFTHQQTAFCTALTSNVFPNILDSYAHIACYIVKFEVASKTVRFHNLFGKALTSELGNQVLQAIYEHSPEVFVNGVPGRNVGGVWLAPNSCDISLVPVNYTDTMTVFPTIMPTSTVIQPTLDILHCLRQPCKNGGSCFENSPGWYCMCMEGYSDKDCSVDIDDCDPNPCQNGGNCIDGIASFTCDCPTGWTGTICTVDVDECMIGEHLCSPEGGVCVDNPGSYSCQCHSGYAGEFCNTEKDVCEAAPCQNDGSCTKTGPGTFSCDCPPLWSGPVCASYLGVCQPNPCQNGGICIDDDTTPRCVCPPQWTGPLCGTDVNECEEDPQACSGHGLCINEDGGFSCNCYSDSYGPLWTGDTCENDVNECLLGIPLCANGECINQQGGYDCICPANFEGDDCSVDVNECESAPCLNGATCNNTYGSYKCVCVTGFTGKKCGTDIDECKPVNPCENDGTCYNSYGSFQCDCRPGWSGPFCSDDINECIQDPFRCKNGGTCKNIDGDYECNCTEEWSGKDCEIYSAPCGNLRCLHGGTCVVDNGNSYCMCPPTRFGPRCENDVNECELPDPVCENGGTCNNLMGSYYCTCPDGFEGPNCENDTNECDPSPCENNGVCENTFGSFKCNCAQGWMGEYCSQDVPECDNVIDPCNNNGLCQEEPGTFRCDCFIGWTGTYCDEDENECETTGCLNGGICNNYPGSWNCTCQKEWTGLVCETDVNECNLQAPPCKNGATCSNSNGDYDCYCTPYWMGKDCDQDVDECMESPPRCKNGATCQNAEGDYDCTCVLGWTGKDCDVDENECQRINPPCKNGAACENLDGDYDCECTFGWTGKDCDVDINECNIQPPQCKNGGACTNEPGDYQCDCTDGWIGKDCDIDENECQRINPPCKNGAACENLDGDYECECTSGWTGKDCDIDINECNIQPPQCKNGGTCTNEPGDYQCDCTNGWIGKNCDIDLDECDVFGDDACFNGGSCTNTDGSFDCQCLPQFKGDDCLEDVDECTESFTPPCMNGATCSNVYGDYYCDCVEGWKGKDCDTDIDECTESEVAVCSNGGTCTNVDGSFSCTCTPQFKGDTCDDDVNECVEQAQTTLCLNQGTCVNDYGDYHCDCTIEWTGKICQTNVDVCSQIPCVNGVCEQVNGVYQCICNTGWEGAACTINIDECLDLSTCKNEGTCEDTVGDYICTCKIGYEGKQCEKDINECLNSPCLNGATCFNNDGSYTCDCMAGYEGKNCSDDVNECLNSPCLNGATCLNNDGSYTCDCLAGYEGKNCGDDINECLNNPCLNSATCINNAGSYTCECMAGYEGNNCEGDINECLNNPCLNAATCLNNDGSYTCDCMAGYEGKNCGDDINECLNDPCLNGATCLNNDGSYTCDCMAGYEGNNCGDDINECLNNPCLNAATCLNNDGSYTCDCMAGYEGKNCGDDINECLNDPCLNGATCLNNDGSYSCDCMAGYEGNNCGDDINECLNNPCLNAATCLNNDGSYTCECMAGYEGNNCEDDIDECLNNPCLNGATCLNNDGSYTCECMAGYEGNNCGDDINECLNNPCLNGASCINNDGSYTCECMAGYEGNNCVDDINECLNSLCLNGATCKNTDGSYTCECVLGFTGDDCGADINECSPFNPCANGGTCVNLIPGFRCDCPEGLSGPLCDGNINECLLNPCLNGATCKDTFSSFECECVVGYTGDTCGGDIDECSNDPCQNGATCMNNFGSYECNCTAGWQGQNCETDIDECFTDPCQNEATCMNNAGSYECNCTAGWQGQNCENDIDECSNDPCQNGANCLNNLGSYECNCTDGLQGQDCETDIDECFNDPCQNGATCMNIFGSYECNCTEGWQGQDCNTDVEECLADPCENGATCVEQPGYYDCDCPLGWQGTHCNIDIDECFDSPCLNGGTCVNEFGSYHCNCTIGFTGQNCGSILQFEFTVQMDLVDDVSNLLDTGTQLFQDYATVFCDHMTAILSSAPGIEFENYDGCDVTSYQVQPNKINWVAHFIKVAPDTLIEDIKNHILSQPTIILDDKNVINVGYNYIYHSDVISMFPVEFELVDDLSELPDLLNPASQMFQNYSDAFCTDISGILAASGSFQKFAQCRVISFADNKVNWMADFSGVADESTGDDIKNHILAQPTEIVDDKNAIGIGNNYIYHSDYISTFPIEFDIVDDLSGLPDLLNPTSQLFQNYSDLFCSNISGLLLASGSFPKFRQCRVTSFAGNKINWIADVNGVADVSTGDTIKSYILSQPTEIVDDKNVISVGNNNIYVSDYISTFPIEFDIVDDLSGMLDLLNPTSQMFQDYSDAFCNNISAILASSGSFQKFRQCRVTSFADSKINWMADFSGVADASTGDDVKNHILTLPTEIVDDKNAINIGNNYIYVSDYISTFPIQFDLVDDLSVLADLLDPVSQMFQDYSDAFCNEIPLILDTTPFFQSYIGCTVVNYTSGDTPNARDVINWLAHFNGEVAESTGQEVKAYIREYPPKIVIDESYAIEIGNNNVYHSDYITTDVVFNRRLLNFTFIQALANPTSAEFQSIQTSFCSNVELIIQQNAGTFSNYANCSIQGYSVNDNGEYMVNFQLQFIGLQDATQIETDFNAVLEKDLPRVTFGRNEGYQVGDLVLFHGVLGTLTTVQMTYGLLNLTYSAELGNPSSTEFMNHASLFCNDLIELIQGEVANDYTCSVDAFSNQEPFPQVTFTFEFLETLDVATLQDLISRTIFFERPRVRVGDDVGNVVGDVVVYYDSLLDYMNIAYKLIPTPLVSPMFIPQYWKCTATRDTLDKTQYNKWDTEERKKVSDFLAHLSRRLRAGWVMNVTEDLFSVPFSQNNLDDPFSETYQKIQTSICDQYTNKFAEVESRYMDCFIPEFRPPAPSERHTQAVVSLVFRGKEPMFEEEITTVMKDFRPVPILGRNWSHVGDYVLYITDFEEIMVNVSAFIQNFTTTTENPNQVITTLELQFQLTNFTLTEGLEDTTSTEFEQMETEICTWDRGFDEVYGPKIAGYTNCSLLQFRNDTDENGTYIDYVDVSVVFKGNLNDDIQEKLRTVLIENGERLSPAPMVWAVAVPANSTTQLFLYLDYLRTADFITNTIITEGVTTLTTLPPA